MKKLLVFVFLFVLVTGINAQIIDIKGKVRDKTIDRADQRTDEGIDKGIDKLEEGVVNIFRNKNDEDSGEDQEEEAEDEFADEENNETVNDKSQKNAPAGPKIESYTKYDFVPGEEIILFEDFSQDAIGDFPALWTTSGSGEVRTLNNYKGNWFYMNAEDQVYCLMKNINLPENYIIEFDMVPMGEYEESEDFSFYLTLFDSKGEYLTDDLYPGDNGGMHLTCTNESWRAIGYKADVEGGHEGESYLAPIETYKLNHVIIWVQGQRLRVYHKGQKVIDLPTLLYSGIKFNRIRFSNWDGVGVPYITNLRFTTAKPDVRSKLLTEGKLVSYGIYFDVNSDKLKPESYGSLNEIAKVLKENPNVRIKVVGHTDGDGDAAKNMDLSLRRAKSVKAELESTFGIASSRIEVDGAGESQPVTSNDTAENKAKNRRVEFIKL